jgi:hypothetical protein
MKCEWYTHTPVLLEQEWKRTEHIHDPSALRMGFHCLSGRAVLLWEASTCNNKDFEDRGEECVVKTEWSCVNAAKHSLSR